ncbi:type VI secretion system Vgr family protein, partial [Paraherbaspirillum soli]
MTKTAAFYCTSMPKLLGIDALHFFSIKGTEHLSELYEYTITLKTPDNRGIAKDATASINLKALLGQEATVAIELDGIGGGLLGNIGKGKREISGLISKARLKQHGERQSTYEVIIEPWLTLAQRTSDYKIFQDKTVVQIIDEVLKDYPYAAELRLDTAKYPTLSYQVQYGESDYDFIQRLMEEWGIYYFFEHSEGKHRLVLCDHVGAHQPFGSEAYHTISYYPPGHKIDEEYIQEFTPAEALVSGQWVTSDYDFERSRANLKAVSIQPRNTAHNMAEIYQWPGDYSNRHEGEMRVRTWMEGEGAQGNISNGGGNLRGMVCGCTFKLSNHPQKKANREYLLVHATLHLQDNGQSSGQGSYECQSTFSVLPTNKVFRPSRVIRKPFTHGPQTAIVVGPAGEEIFTDQYGRVKVRFHWDRYARNDHSDSCWIRVSQAWAGSGFGGIFIPRIGQEVIVDFLNGDPDRPLIIGSLYNNFTSPPWQLPGNATQSGVMSRSIKGGSSNYNALRFEDKSGAEEFYVQAEKDMSRLTKNDESHSIGSNHKLRVGKDQDIVVGGSLYSSTHGNAKYSFGKAHASHIRGSSANKVNGRYALTVGKEISLVCGASSLVLQSDGCIMLNGLGITINGLAVNIGGMAGVNLVGGAGVNVVAAGAVNVTAAAATYVQGSELHLNEGGGAGACSGGNGGLAGDLGLIGLAGLFPWFKFKPGGDEGVDTRSRPQLKPPGNGTSKP